MSATSISASCWSSSWPRRRMLRCPRSSGISVAVTPAFVSGELIGFGVSIAHKADVGGLVPGSSSAASREIYHDGLRLPPVRYQTADGIDGAVEDIIRDNSRTPDLVIGD